MEETHSFWAVCTIIAPAAGVVALFSAAECPYDRSKGRYLIDFLWPVVVMILIAWGLWMLTWPAGMATLSVILLLICGCCLGIMLHGLIPRQFIRQRPYDRVGALVLIVIGWWISSAVIQEDDRRYWVVRNQREKLEQELAAAQKASDEEFARMRQKRDPERFHGHGVAEAQGGPVIAWLAVQPTIEVDWEFERGQPGERPAQRKIPLSISVLNNRFEQSTLAPISLPGDFPGEKHPALWLAWISRRDEKRALVYFSGPMPHERQWLAPAERMDFTVNWNGRAHGGDLLPPGGYTVHLSTAGLDAAKQTVDAVLDFKIQDSGPIIQVIPDPLVQQLNEHQRTEQERQKNMEMMDRLRQINVQPVLPPFSR